jgi:hypothetical protein
MIVSTKSTNVIWQMDPDDLSVCIERDWVRSLLSNVSCEHHVDMNQGRCQFSLVLPNAIVIISDPGKDGQRTAMIVNYLKRFADPPILWHMSDENCRSEIDRIYPLTRGVIRNGNVYTPPRHPWLKAVKYALFNEPPLPDSFLQIPLGFDTFLENASGTFKPASERENVWIFTGALKHDRGEMLSALESIRPNTTVVTGDWGESLSRFRDTAELLGDAVFAPCPKGNHCQECNREYDALEWGCIPIFMDDPESGKTDYHHYLLGDNPIPVVKSWQECAAFIRNCESADVLQQRIHSWWQDYKKCLATSIAAFVGQQHVVT